MNTLRHLSILIGRVGLSAIFILSGIAKLGAGYAGTQGYMEAMGVPGALLPLVIFAE
ncbi:MAG: DoxX family membrane protein, partial [Bdellovibrio bacteriovorus]